MSVKAALGEAKGRGWSGMSSRKLESGSLNDDRQCARFVLEALVDE